MEIISTDALISINATVFAQLITFLLFMFALNKIMVSPLRKIALRRNKYLDTIYTDINSSRDKIKTLETEVIKKKIVVIDDSSLIISKMENKANRKAISIYHQAKKEINIFQKKSDVQIHKQIKKLRNDLHNDIDIISMLIMEKILDRRLTK